MLRGARPRLMWHESVRLRKEALTRVTRHFAPLNNRLCNENF